MKVSTFILSMLLATGLSATDNLPRSLKDAIAIAVKNNPKTVSTNELLESIRFQTLASKADMYPSASASCSGSMSRGQSSYVGSTTPYAGRNGDCGISLNVTIYDGKASYYNYKAAEANEAATKAAYNTSDSMIPNTRGGLANQALGNYISVSDSIGSIKNTNTTLEFLYAFEKVSDDYNLKSKITETEQSLDQMNASLQLQKESFEYTVTLPPSDDLNDFDTTIASFSIPASADDAIELALTNGPEVVRRNLNVQMAEFSLKAIKGNLGPSITLSASAARNINQDRMSSINNSSSVNKNVGIVVSIPLGVSGHYRIKSSEASLASAKSEREAAIADAKYSISAQYKRLVNLRNKYLTYNKNYNDQLNYLKSLITNIDAGRSSNVDATQFLTAIETFERRHSQLQHTQIEILYTLFGIQQVTGQLFSEVGLI